jgi:hypothetical protein
MNLLSLALRASLGSVVLLAAAAVSPARADTTVAQYDKLTKQQQAHFLGTMLQSLADDLQKSKREGEAQCLAQLYTNPPSEGQAVQSLGMTDLLETLAVAREKGPDKFTIEEIITRQMILLCGTTRKGNSPPRQP